MANNVVLFVDVTDNDGLKDQLTHEDTNVWKLYNACNDPAKQYLPGVGTGHVDPLGLMWGFGTKKRLQSSYEFLLEHHRQGYNIFLFGFSRGAVAVRLFADFLGLVGSMFGDPIYRKYLASCYQIYVSSKLLRAEAQFSAYLRDLLGDRETPTPIPIHFLGVWDTVVGGYPVGLANLTTLPHHIKCARHALALHERRGEMEPTLWEEWDSSPHWGIPGVSRVKQVWFPGAHSDVGGGYPDGRLAEQPLSWMIREAHACKLKVTPPSGKAGKRILHQDRTGGRPLGAVVTLRKGEQPREALSTFSQRYSDLAKPNVQNYRQLIESLFVDKTALQNLVNPATLQLKNYPLRFPGFADPKTKVTQDLTEIDSLTTRMYLTLRKTGKRPVQ
jgi:uncharacterized protein (DUF2235 family)